jgi:hypothetical protein
VDVINDVYRSSDSPIFSISLSVPPIFLQREEYGFTITFTYRRGSRDSELSSDANAATPFRNPSCLAAGEIGVAISLQAKRYRRNYRS